MKTELVIDAEDVHRTFIGCLNENGKVEVEGIMHTFIFDSERLETVNKKVKKWLNALPHEFFRSGGGGWSFLNACNQANGIQWTGLHSIMDELFCLGLGLKMVKCLLPREMWEVLPRGMPFYVVEDGDENENKKH